MRGKYKKPFSLSSNLPISQSPNFCCPPVFSCKICVLSLLLAALAVASLTAVKGPTDSERILRELQETALTITSELGIQYESEHNPL
jgi:hypothetical protein